MFLGGLFFEWIQTVLILAGYVSGNATFPKPLNKSEEKKYLDLYAKGDESAKNVLIEHNLRLVAHIAKKYADEKNLEDLISIGTIGLIKGINTFNPEKNSRLSTYISRCIENEVLMVMRSSKKLQNEISIDESIGTDREGNNMTFSDILTCDSTDIADLISGKLEAQKLYNAMKMQNEIVPAYSLGEVAGKLVSSLTAILSRRASGNSTVISRLNFAAVKNS